MKILFQSRKTLFTVPGGDTTQIVKTAEYLRKEGCEVDISTEFDVDLTPYDVVHLFNLMRPQELDLFVQNAKKYTKPIALSTIYGLYTEYDKKARGGLYGVLANLLGTYQIEYMKVLARAIVNREFHEGTVRFLKRGYLSLQKEMAADVAVFLPNSHSEMKRVSADLALSRMLLILKCFMEVWSSMRM